MIESMAPARSLARARRRRAVAVAACALAPLAACLTPPALLPAHEVDVEGALRLYPPGTERVEIALPSGETLRGVHVPSDEGAPLVLHMLESSGSVASMRLGYGELCAQLADLGYASLAIDYRGVGGSDGERSVDHLAADAAAMWDEAVRRADGDPSRVVVRGTSIGAVAAATLLERGARPRALVLISPVLADSVVTRFARTFHGRLAAAFASVAYRDVARVDLADAIRAAGVPTFLITGENDSLLDEDDRRALDDAARSTGGGLRRRDGDHLSVGLEAHVLLRDERGLYEDLRPEPPPPSERLARLFDALPADLRPRFAEGTEARARLAALAGHCIVGDPTLLAAASLGSKDARAAARMVWLRREIGRPPLALAFDDLVAALSLEDPAGDLPIDLIEDCARPAEIARRSAGLIVSAEPELVASEIRDGWSGFGRSSWSVTFTVGGGPAARIAVDADDVALALRERGLGPDDARRQLVRIAFKAQRIPDRLTVGPDGSLVLEALGEDGWRTIQLATEAPRVPE